MRHTFSWVLSRRPRLSNLINLLSFFWGGEGGQSATRVVLQISNFFRRKHLKQFKNRATCVVDERLTGGPFAPTFLAGATPTTASISPLLLRVSRLPILASSIHVHVTNCFLYRRFSLPKLKENKESSLHSSAAKQWKLIFMVEKLVDNNMEMFFVSYFLRVFVFSLYC